MTEDTAALRRLTRLVGAAVLIDTTFYAVVAPLLPGLSHSLHLSKLGAGVLTASYPAGMLVASVPGGVLAVRRGPRVAVCVGLVVLFCSTVAFALLRSAPGLDGARFLEGVGGACSWDGGIAWLVAVSSPGRRGRVIGQTMAAAIGGSVAGRRSGPSPPGRAGRCCSSRRGGGLDQLASYGPQSGALSWMPLGAPSERALGRWGAGALPDFHGLIRVLQRDNRRVAFRAPVNQQVVIL